MAKRPIEPGQWRLTRGEMNPRGGCQCKLAGLDLQDILDGARKWATQEGARLVAPGNPEDCAIIEVPASRLLLSTDLTPIVGVDLFAAGRIAALHSMSDIYACGGLPRWGLVTLVVEAEQRLDYAQAVLGGILKECAAEGAEVVGGQTVVGPEAMAGLTVIGVPRSDRILRKKGAQPDDVLLLSKPLGVGLILRGYKLGLLDEAILATAISVMTISNASASAAMVEAGVHASTDVTGFGMLGHLAEMLTPDLGAILELTKIPVLPGAQSLPVQAVRTIWIENNYEYATARNRISGIIDAHRLTQLLDPQTNGGLIVSASRDAARKLQNRGFSVIGQVTRSVGFEIRE